MPNLVEIENLHVKFNTDSGEVNAVNGISFDIKKGLVKKILEMKNKCRNRSLRDRNERENKINNLALYLHVF